MRIEKRMEYNTHDLTGKTIAITGSTGGLASFLVENLAKLNVNFIFINRSKEKTDEQISNLLKLYPNLKLEFIQCDLSNFESVQSTTKILKTKDVDILYLCAGAYNIQRYRTNLNYDNVFQINFISQYHMAKELLNNIKSRNGKIVAESACSASCRQTLPNSLVLRAFARKMGTGTNEVNTSAT